MIICSIHGSEIIERLPSFTSSYAVFTPLSCYLIQTSKHQTIRYPNNQTSKLEALVRPLSIIITAVLHCVSQTPFPQHHKIASHIHYHTTILPYSTSKTTTKTHTSAHSHSNNVIHLPPNRPHPIYRRPPFSSHLLYSSPRSRTPKLNRSPRLLQ